MVLTYFKNALKFIQYHTYSEFFSRLWVVLRKPLYENTSRYILRLKLESAIVPDSKLDIREFTTDDTDKLLDVMYISRADLEKRFADKERCFVALCNGRIVSYFWAQFGLKNLDELHLKLNLPPNEAWMYNAVTIKTARGRGLYPNIIGYMARVLLQSGVDESFIDVDPENRSSIRGLVKAGCTRVALIQMRKIFSTVSYKLTVLDLCAWQQLLQVIEDFRREGVIMEVNIACER